MAMDIAILTIFPAIFNSYMGESIMARAHAKGLFTLDVRDIREYSTDKHRKVDDYPYGGGPGMVMMPEPVWNAAEAVKSDGRPTRTIVMSPQGRAFDQGLAVELSQENRRLMFICPRYEGMDHRAIAALADDEISVGDYVLTGGELPALVIIDALVRLLPGAVGDECSLENESFSWGILDYPHYTRPPQWRGMSVPEVLLSGDHAKVERYRRKEALRRTMHLRPDLLDGAGLDDKDIKLLSEIKKEEEK